MVEAAVALGVLLNVLLFETVGLSAGGMVVPGYLALFWDQPQRVGTTFGLAVVTWLVVTRGVRRWIVLYGRRRYAAMIVIGMGLSVAVNRFLPAFAPTVGDWRAIGFLLPGLMANEMEQQGVFTTLLVTAGLTAVVRLVLVFLVGR